MHDIHEVSYSAPIIFKDAIQMGQDIGNNYIVTFKVIDYIEKPPYGQLSFLLICLWLVFRIK